MLGCTFEREIEEISRRVDGRGGKKERQEEGLSEIVFHDEVIDWWRREDVFSFLFEYLDV